jgi:hypothetical protein
MVALNDLTWPHLVPSKRSQSSLKSSPSRDSVKEAVLGVETQQAPQRRVTSDEGQACTESFPCFSPDCVGIQSRARSHTVAIKDHDTSSHKVTKFRTEDGTEDLPRTKALLPTQPEGSTGDFALSQFPASLVVRRVILAADNDLDNLQFIPHTPISLLRYAFASRVSFNTSVEDLVQSNPDTPIGDEMAPPMKQRSFNVGTPAMDHGQTPRIKISPPSITKDGKKPLRSRSNFSDPFEAPPTFLGWDKRAARSSKSQSERSSPMVTAPETPRTARHPNCSDASHDGPAVGGTRSRSMFSDPFEPVPSSRKQAPW